MFSRKLLSSVQIGLLAYALFWVAGTWAESEVNPFAPPARSDGVGRGEMTLDADEETQQAAYRVVGISGTADMTVAVLRLRDSAYRLIEVGDEFDGMKVVAIDEKRVTLKTESGMRYLFLSY